MSKAVKTTTRQNLKYARLHESEKIQAVHNCFVGRLETPSFFPKLLRDYDFSLDDSFAFITSERLIVEPEEEFKKSSKWAWWVAVQVAGYLMGTPAHGKRVAANRATFTPLEGGRYISIPLTDIRKVEPLDFWYWKYLSDELLIHLAGQKDKHAVPLKIKGDRKERDEFIAQLNAARRQA
jgi:hypothetical protein